MFNRFYKYYFALLLTGLLFFLSLSLNSNPLSSDNNSEINLIRQQNQLSISVDKASYAYSDIMQQSRRISILRNRTRNRRREQGGYNKPDNVHANLLTSDYKSSHPQEFTHTKQIDKTNHEVFLN
jgi:hypothetical protein